MMQLSPGILNLPAFLILWIGLHKRQTDIRLWHYNGERRFRLQADSSQLLVQDGHRLTHVIAAGRQRPAIGIVGFRDAQLSDKVPVLSDQGYTAVPRQWPLQSRQPPIWC